MRGLNRRQFVAVALAAAPGRLYAGQSVDPALLAAIASPTRSPFNVARDQYRHPAEALTFFGLRDDQTVLEIEPGRGYWTEILAPYLKAHGRYIAAVPPAGAKALLGRLRSDPADYGEVTVTGFGGRAAMAPAGSANLVLSFRNLHDWMADGSVAATMRAIHVVLKSGGVLGMEDHRGLSTRPQDPRAKSGYVREDYARTLMESFGFRLVGVSQIGDNPRDTKDYPKGVWTLPPVLALGAADRAKYLAIGESDRWTMKFMKT